MQQHNSSIAAAAAAETLPRCSLRVSLKLYMLLLLRVYTPQHIGAAYTPEVHANKDISKGIEQPHPMNTVFREEANTLLRRICLYLLSIIHYYFKYLNNFIYIFLYNTLFNKPSSPCCSIGGPPWGPPWAASVKPRGPPNAGNCLFF